MSKCEVCKRRPPRPHGKKCERCHKRQWRANNPLKSAYANLRDKAIHRGKGLELTYKEFVDFCNGNDYMEKKGKHPGCLHIDRIDHRKPYRRDNIQVLTIEENGKKGFFEGNGEIDEKVDLPF